MLHTKFRGNLPASSGEEDFKKRFTSNGHGGHLGHVTSILSSDFHSLFLKAFVKNWFRSAKQFLRKSGLIFCMYMSQVQVKHKQIESI